MKSTKQVSMLLGFILTTGTVLFACSDSSGTSGNGTSGGSSTQADSGSDAKTSAIPTVKAGCSEVCDAVTTCGISQSKCDSVCPSLNANCRTCLVRTVKANGCEGADECASVCGDVSDPNKLVEGPKENSGANCDLITYTVSSASCDGNFRLSGEIPSDMSSSLGSDADWCASNVSDNCNEVSPTSLTGEKIGCFANGEEGWKCVEVPSFLSGKPAHYLCVPPSLNICKESQINR